MRKRLKLIRDGVNSCSKKYKREYGSAYVGVWRSLRLEAVWIKAVGFVLVPLAEIYLQSL
jgi:hypothetical protein